MSDIKMCDNCGNVFSVNEKGWREFTESARGDSDRDIYHNSHNHGAITRHIGPCCNLTNKNGLRPRIMMQELPDGRIDTGYNND